jgi:hypothetical protein
VYGHGPYYAFHPRVAVGFGFYAGFPVPYPYGFYPGPYPYPYYGYYPAPAYRYAPYYGRPYYARPYPYAAPYHYHGPIVAPHGHISGPVSAPGPVDQRYAVSTARTSSPVQNPAPAAREPAGLSFSVTPAAAAVYVDNVYAGEAQSFSATAPPLNVAAGRHQVELRANGFQPARFQVDAVAGQVVPFQGTLRQQ